MGPSMLEPPNPKCPVCGTAQLTLEIDTAKTTFKEFLDKVRHLLILLPNADSICENGSNIAAPIKHLHPRRQQLHDPQEAFSNVALASAFLGQPAAADCIPEQQSCVARTTIGYFVDISGMRPQFGPCSYGGQQALFVQDPYNSI